MKQKPHHAKRQNKPDLKHKYHMFFSHKYLFIDCIKQIK